MHVQSVLSLLFDRLVLKLDLNELNSSEFRERKPTSVVLENSIPAFRPLLLFFFCYPLMVSFLPGVFASDQESVCGGFHRHGTDQQAD